MRGVIKKKNKTDFLKEKRKKEEVNIRYVGRAHHAMKHTQLQN